MAGGNFMYRVISYVANEFVVNGLASSRTFQKFVVKTDKIVKSIPERAAQVKNQITEQVKEVSETLKNKQ